MSCPELSREAHKHLIRRTISPVSFSFYRIRLLTTNYPPLLRPALKTPKYSYNPSCLSRTVRHPHTPQPNRPKAVPQLTRHPRKTTDAFPSSAAFDVINSALQSDEAERKDAIKNAKAVVAFNLKNASGQEESWYLDLKDKGVVGKGAAPPGGKADGSYTPSSSGQWSGLDEFRLTRGLKLTVTLSLSDADFGSLVSGKANAQRLFMGGKLKIKGNIMKATKMEPVLKKAQSKAKL